MLKMGLSVYRLQSDEESRFSQTWETLNVRNGVLMGHDNTLWSSPSEPRMSPVISNSREGTPTVLMVSSWDTACGIAEYTKTLAQCLKPYYHVDVLHADKIRMETPPAIIHHASLIHIQYEPGLYDRDDLLAFVKAQDLPIILTSHFYDDWLFEHHPLFARVIVHNDDSKILNLPNHIYIVQGCPVFDEIPNKDQLRQVLGLPIDKRILTGFGLIMAWKQIDYFFNYLARAIGQDRNLFVQLLHARYPRSPGLSKRVIENIESAIQDFGIVDRVYFSWNFLSKSEINQRLQASDLGYIWGNAVSMGSSATTKEYIAGRCPLVVPDCSHYGDLDKGLIKVPIGSIHQFLHTLLATVYDDSFLAELRAEQRTNYGQLNYQRVAEKHADIYGRVLNNPTLTDSMGA